MNKQNSWKDWKERIDCFLNQNSSKFLKETDKRAYTAENVKLTVQSAQIL